MRDDSPQTIIDRLHADLLRARKARDSVTASVLQTIIAAIDNAGAISATSDTMPSIGVGSTEMPRRELSAQDVQELIRTEIAELRHASAELGGIENAYTIELRDKVAVLEHYL